MEKNKLSNSTIPNPIPMRNCKCCGIEFQPDRKDQECIDSKHYHNYYNHQVRPKKNKAQKEQEKIQRANNQLIGKHYIHLGGYDGVEEYYAILEADGFRFDFFVGSYTEEGEEDIQYFFTYDYYYCHAWKDGLKTIKIYQR